MNKIPLKIFIGSSYEQKDIAKKLAKRLDKYLISVRWWKSFPPGKTTLESLINQTKECAMAVFVIGPDDIVIRNRKSGKEIHQIARDNVTYEHGLFTGSLGQQNSLMLVDKSDVVKIGSDLNGVNYITWNKKSMDTLDDAVDAIVKVGNDLVKENGLGWWIMKSINTTSKNREFFGVFQTILSGNKLYARSGSIYYGKTFNNPLIGKVKELWDSKEVSFEYKPNGNSSLIIMADVISLAHQNDPSKKAKSTKTFRTRYEVYDMGDQIFKGHFLNMENLQNEGSVICKKVSANSQKKALNIAKKEFRI